nr:hypothetical protein [Prevotella sp.]
MNLLNKGDVQLNSFLMIRGKKRQKSGKEKTMNKVTDCCLGLMKKQKVPHKSVWIARKVPHKNVIDFVISLIFSVIRDKRMLANIHLKQKYGLGYRVLCEPVDSFCGEYDKKNKSGSSPKKHSAAALFLVHSV